jgi:hypothetical protein
VVQDPAVLQVRQALREWLALAAIPVREDRLEQLDLQALRVLLERRGLPDFPALLVAQGLLDPKEPKAPPALRALRELLGPKDPQARQVRRDHKGRRAPKESKDPQEPKE